LEVQFMNTLRIMTFNMLHAPGDRLGQLVDVVKSVDPDVLACQEVNTYEGMMQLSRELGMVPVWGRANSHEDTRDGQPLYEHLVVLTKRPAVTVRVHGGDRRAMYRPVLEVGIETPGGTVSFFVVHLRAVLDATERYLKWRELGALLAVIADADGPVVALGDFNALPPGELPATGVRRELPEDHLAAFGGGVVAAITNAGLADSLRLVRPYPGTPDSTLRDRPGARVDYIFVSEDLRDLVTKAYIVDDEAVSAASDHRPVVAEVTFPG
jgi:endonuclease/exonuclease/phosphatase family metal-dependent hydrolase